jgi:hypothetical protein
MKKNDIFKEELLLNMENVMKIKNKDNIELKEAIEAMETTNYERVNEEETDVLSNEEDFCREMELDTREQQIEEEIGCLRAMKKKIESAPSGEENWILKEGTQGTWSDSYDQGIREIDNWKRQNVTSFSEIKWSYFNEY